MPAAPHEAHAQTPSAQTPPPSARATAKDLGGRGFSALDRGDWKTAETLFRRADATFHAPTLLLGLARAEVHLGKLVEATAHYRQIIDEGPPPDATLPMIKAVESAKEEIGKVKARCALVIVRVVGVSPATMPNVTVDDAPLPNDAVGTEHLLNPGTHRIAVRAEGYAPADTSLTLAEGESREVSLTLVPEGSAADSTGSEAIKPSAQGGREGSTPSTQRIVGITALGVGGVGLVAGAVSGILAISQRSSLSGSPCAGGGCDKTALDSYQNDLSRYHTTTAVATVGFTVAAAGGIAGAILLLTAPSGSKSQVAIVPYAGPGSIGATGHF